MKTIGVLGGSGEIGKRVVAALKSEYQVLATYYSNPPKEDSQIYTQLDIADEQKLADFISKCDVIVNCAGACFINGERIARAAAAQNVPLVDPSGESFLEEKISDLVSDHIFVLSSGCFPGMTGILMEELCKRLDQVQEISGMSISTEIPSYAAVEDFVLTNIAGFGTALNYFEKGEYKRDDSITEIEVNGEGFRLQNYYTIEVEKIVKAYKPEKANWYNVMFGGDIMNKMQEAVIKFRISESIEEFKKTAAQIREMFVESYQRLNEFNYLRIDAAGTANGQEKQIRAEINNQYSSEVSAAVAAYAAKAVAERDIKNGLYYAMDIIDVPQLIARLPDLKIALNISEEILGEAGDDYEEGEI